MSERATQASGDTSKRARGSRAKEWITRWCIEHALPFGGGEIVGSLRLAFLAGAWIGHANHEPRRNRTAPSQATARQTASQRLSGQGNGSVSLELRGSHEQGSEAPRLGRRGRGRESRS